MRWVAPSRGYAIRNTGSWPGVAALEVDYVVQIGDANADGRVLFAGVPVFVAADNDRRDIDGDGRVLNIDIALTNTQSPSFAVPKPSGHACMP